MGLPFLRERWRGTTQRLDCLNRMRLAVAVLLAAETFWLAGRSLRGTTMPMFGSVSSTRTLNDESRSRMTYFVTGPSTPNASRICLKSQVKRSVEVQHDSPTMMENEESVRQAPGNGRHDFRALVQIDITAA